MISKEYKRLADLDFPVAEMSTCLARARSIGHGHPSALHLRWAQLPLGVEVCHALKKESPNLFHDIEVYDECDGMPAVRVTHSKV